MEDPEHVCPLCCEELDISDREFYPCKCGYQVCMWCWHRIRESESGLCPACRTPYGEDPHQFSAVDVEEVLKANKEREAAEKRKKQQEMEQQMQEQQQQLGQQQQQMQLQQQQLVGGAATSSSGAFGAGASLGTSSHHHHHYQPMEVPKDRSQLVNMRVIRRNLVYAVGLPPAIATEDILKKADYFGQYGKISKIVMNRAAVGGGDATGRRASASAYVTFVHKEDTLACILALDGFYMEGRNVRASYGTSKYCSAFIKNVRCNNPECTYLHEMGAAEDTFTKQEIQAGYVTSGRDVLARQQQIVAEQLRQSATSGNVVPRKRVGGGGPSGTGRSSANPVFPPPEYDEPSRPSTSGLVPTPVGVTRAVTTSTVASLNPSNIAAKLGRSSSMGRGAALGAFAAVPTTTTTGGVPVNAATATAQQRSKSAASIVAGVHSYKTAEQAAEPHTTLTPLTPLKRTTKAGGGGTAGGIRHSNSADDAINPNIKRGTKKPTNGIRAAATAAVGNNNNSSLAGLVASKDSSSIGGEVIAAPTIAPVLPNLSSSAATGTSTMRPPAPEVVGGLTSALGGEVFTGELRPKTATIGPGADHLRGGVDKWNNAVGGSPLPTGLWNESSTVANSNSSSNALASILGINLPTGSGSLSSGLWSSAPAPTHPAPTGPSALSALNGSAVPTGFIGGVGVGPSAANSLNINNSNNAHGSPPIGGVPIGGSAGYGMSAPAPSTSSLGAPIGGSYSGKSDIALLQSLLPGVHITSGHESNNLYGIANRNLNSNNANSNNHNINNNNNSSSGWSNQGSGGLGGDTLPGWGGPSSVGAIGQAQSNKGPGIW